MSESRKMSACNEFQIDGLATEKARRPNILSRYTVVWREVWQITDDVVK